MAPKVLIIGGGIAGLSTGCYARMNGFDTIIYEMHSIPGGLCTAWKRKDYVFDGCLHWLVGSEPISSYYPIWEEVGAVQGKTMLRYPYFTKVRNLDGKEFTVYTDPGQLEQEMLTISPEDKKLIRRISRDIRSLMKNDIAPQFSFKTLIPMLRAIRLIYRYKMPVKELAAKFKSEELREFFIKGLDWGDTCSAFLLWTLALMANGKAGYPIGGSRALIDSVTERYQSLGGKLECGKKVTGIIVEQDQAVGIRLEDGTEHRGDIIVSAADGHTTLFEWLGGKYNSKEVDDAYANYTLFPPLVYISLGIREDLNDKPTSLTFDLPKPFSIGKQKVETLFYKNYANDPTMAPKGKTVLTFMITTEYPYWEQLYKDKEAYKIQKEQIAESVIQNLDKLYPGIREDIEIIDVATPNTFVRYTGNWRGSYEGWLMTKKNLRQRNLMTLPKLKNFYMVGHWVSPGGGLPSGLLTGRIAVKKICKTLGKSFSTNKS